MLYADDGYREVANSVTVRRAFGNRLGSVDQGTINGATVSRVFDDDGNIIRHEDALNAVTYWERDAQGRVVREIDALGNVQEISRDRMGNPVQASDALGVFFRAQYDRNGNVTELVRGNGDMFLRAYDAQGNVLSQVGPKGDLTRYVYDVMGNKVRQLEADGSEWNFRYDYWGRCIAQVNPLGHETRFVYDDAGKVIAIYYPNGAVARRSYNQAGDLVQAIEPSGEMWRAEYLLRKAVRVIAPDNSVMEYRYSREARLVEILNERGEGRKLRLDAEGQVIEVTSFDGRQMGYKYDLRNRLVEVVDHSGDRTIYERDLLGRITAVEYSDGEVIRFEYDARSRLSNAENSSGQYKFEYDAAGLLTREQRSLDGIVDEVEHRYDLARERVFLGTSTGLMHVSERDVRGRAVRSELNDGHQIDFGWDSLSREVRRSFGEGLIQVSEYGTLGGYLSRTVEGPGGPKRADLAAHPEWVGVQGRTPIARKIFEYAESGERINRRYDQDFGDLVYQYDLRSRLTEARASTGTREAFAYDATSNVHEAGAARRYEGGNILKQRQGTTYEWDLGGRLIAKRSMSAEGQISVSKYDWNGRGLLKGVDLPDGSRVEFSYDPFARRVGKRVLDRAEDGGVKVVSQTRYLWDKDLLIQEIRESAVQDGDPIISERSYYYDEAEGFPLAQREVSKQHGQMTSDTGVQYFVNDPIGTPEHLIDAQGSIVARVHRSVWGKVDEVSAEATPIRFRGQYHDTETGLHYNRYRYYDPETGRYISQDPAGGLPDPNLYIYCDNPVDSVDPLGLVHRARATFTPQPEGSPPSELGLFTSSYNSEQGNHSREYNAREGIIPWANLTARDENGVLLHRTSDTEAQIIRHLESTRSDEELRGGHLHIVGELSPCSRCEQRMQEFADRHGATVEYEWTGRPSAQRIIDRDRGRRSYGGGG